jgi:hypothetical protein
LEKVNPWSFVMANLFSRAIALLNSFIKSLQVKQFFALALVGLLFLAVPAQTQQSNSDLGRRIGNVLEKSNSERPTTTGEWEEEAREVEGNPGERLKRIGKESKEAFKEFGGLYPDTAERSGETLQDTLEGRGNN